MGFFVSSIRFTKCSDKNAAGSCKPKRPGVQYRCGRIVPVLKPVFRKERDGMSKIKIENAEENEAVQGQTETVVNGKPFNRMNDFYVKYVFASRQNKGSALALINSVFALDGAKEIVDFEFKDRELDPDRIVPQQLCGAEHERPEA